MGAATATLRTTKDIASDLQHTQMVGNGVVKATGFLAKIESFAPFLGKIMPFVEKAAPFVEKAAIPVTAVAGSAKAAWEFSGGHNREGSQTLGSTGGTIAGAIGGAEAGGAIGTLICPGIGTAIGAGVGGIAMGFAGSAAGKWLGGWIHDRVVDVKHAFNSSASGAPALAPVRATGPVPGHPALAH